MKKNFKKIIVNVIYVSQEDVICTSNNNNQLDEWDEIVRDSKNI